MSTTTPTMEPAAAPIDPRIRARRIEVRRQTGRRRLQRLVDLGLVLLVAALFAGALWTPLLDVDEVVITGADRSGADAVAEAAGVAPGDPLVSVDLAAVGARLAGLPWVAEVRLHRGLDGLVSVAVTERVPVAVVGVDPPMVVDADGRVLAPRAQAGGRDPLVALTGLASVPAPGGYLRAGTGGALALAAHLARVAPGALTTLAVDGLTGTLAVGGEVRFGDARQLGAKVRALQVVLEQVDLTCLAGLDLRLPGSPVLTREEACS